MEKRTKINIKMISIVIGLHLVIVLGVALYKSGLNIEQGQIEPIVQTVEVNR